MERGVRFQSSDGGGKGNVSEDRKWRPDRWSKETILRRICKARRQIMRLARQDDEQPVPGVRESLACMDASENAVDSIECAAIAETLKRAASRIVTMRLPLERERECPVEKKKRSANTAGARKKIRAGGAAG